MNVGMNGAYEQIIYWEEHIVRYVKSQIDNITIISIKIQTEHKKFMNIKNPLDICKAYLYYNDV